MDNRPFYELDDDELLIEEAAQAALSDAVSPVATTATMVPALPLRCSLDHAQIAALAERFTRKQTLTLLDHAYLIDKLACTLDKQSTDTYGFAAAMRAEAALLLLDMMRGLERPRSEAAEYPAVGIQRIRTAPLEYGKPLPPGLSLRLERDALTHFAQDADDSGGFFAFRRLTLALMPTFTALPILTDTLERYAMSARIFINSAAAKQALLPWASVAQLSDTTAEDYARSIIDLLRSNTGVIDG